MKDEARTREQLINELVELRQRIVELEKVEEERKRAEEAARTWEEICRGVVESSAAVVYIVRAGRFEWVSPLFEKISGYKSRELIGTRSLDYVHPQDREIVRKGAIWNLTGRSISPYAFRFMRKRGEPVWVLEKVSSIQYRGERAAVGSFMDLAKRKWVEEALKESEELSRGLLEAATVGTYIVQDGKFQYVNPQFEQISGYTSDELIGTYSLKYVHPEDRKKVGKKAKEHLKGQSSLPLPYEFRFISKDGRTLWVLERVASIEYRGKPAVVGSVMDITERKQAEEALQESEERYRTLVDQMEEGYVVFRGGRIRFANRRCAEVLGIPAEKLVGEDYLTFLAPESQELARQTYETIVEGREVPHFQEYVYLAEDGRRVPVEVSMREVIYAGKPSYAAVFRDIGERKQAEEALQESEERYRCVVETAHDAIISIDSGGDVVFFSRAAETIFGYSASEIIGKPLTLLLPERFREAYREGFDRLVATAELRDIGELRDVGKTVEFVGLRKDGSEFLVEHSLALWKLKGEAFFTAHIRDITERKQAEEELRESEEKRRILFESIADGVVAVNAEGRIVEANDAGVRMAGCSDKEELLGRNVLELVAEKDRSRIVEDMAKTMEEGRPLGTMEYTLLAADGREIDAEIGTAVLSDSAGNITTFIGVIRDITERKRLEEGLRESEEKLRTIFESIGDGIVITDLEGSIIDENEAALRMKGYSHKEDAIGQSGLEFIAERDRARAVKDIAGALETGHGPAMEYTFVAKDGREFDGEASASLLRDSSGNPVGFISVVRDIAERKRVEETLRESEEKLRTIFESIGDGISVTDLEGRIVDVNEAQLRMFGYSHKEEAIGRSGFEFIAERDRARTIEDMMKALETGHGPAVEYTFVAKDGREFDGEASASLLRDSSGNPAGFISVVRDITERKRAEEVLKESEELNRSLIEGATGGTYIVQEGKFQYVSLQFEQVSGYTSDEFLGVNSLDYVHPDDKEGVRKAAVEQLKGQSTLPYEYRFICKDGRTLWILERVTSIEYRGKPAALGSIMDITERKRAEEELRQSEERQRIVFEAIKDGIIVTDLEGRILDVNEATLRMQGQSREELIGQNSLSFIAEKDRPMVTKDMKEALRDMGTATMEYRWVAKDGTGFDSEASAALLRDNSGKPEGLIFVTRDVTERKKVERMKSDFVSLVSHQLKTPVAEVRAYIENMLAGLTGDLTTKQEQYLQDMRNICSGNYRLISDLLDVSRIERGMVSVDIQPVELREVVDSALGDRRKRIEEKGLTLNLEEADERVAVLADKTKMAEALSNVIDNAVKFTDKGSIAIKMRRKGKYGIVEVKDTGKGMSRDVLKDLFKEGRVLAGGPMPGRGAGLGLYIARSLMKLQQGDITATSAVGKGSTVVLKIPRG